MIQIHVGYRQMHACMLCVPVNRPRHLFSAFTAKGLRKNNGSKTFNCGNVEKVCAVEYFVYIMLLHGINHYATSGKLHGSRDDE